MVDLFGIKRNNCIETLVVVENNCYANMNSIATLFSAYSSTYFVETSYGYVDEKHPVIRSH